MCKCSFVRFVGLPMAALALVSVALCVLGAQPGSEAARMVHYSHPDGADYFALLLEPPADRTREEALHDDGDGDHHRVDDQHLRVLDQGEDQGGYQAEGGAENGLERHPAGAFDDVYVAKEF